MTYAHTHTQHRSPARAHLQELIAGNRTNQPINQSTTSPPAPAPRSIQLVHTCSDLLYLNGNLIRVLDPSHRAESTELHALITSHSSQLGYQPAFYVRGRFRHHGDISGMWKWQIPQFLLHGFLMVHPMHVYKMYIYACMYDLYTFATR